MPYNEKAEIFDLLDEDVLLIPANYLFNSETLKFTINFTNANGEAIELSAENTAAIAAATDQLIKCRIKKISAEDLNLATVEIEIEPGKILNATLRFISADAVTGISIFRYVSPHDIVGTPGTPNLSPSISPTLTPSSPSGSPSGNKSRPGLLQLFSRWSSGSKQFIREWHSWDLSVVSPDVVQMLQASEPFSAFKLSLDAKEFGSNKRLVMARRKLLDLEKVAVIDTQHWTDIKIIKDIIVKKLKVELESIDVIPNLFESEFTPKINDLLNIYKIIGNESEIETDIANIYEIILQDLFTQNDSAVVIGNIIAAWNHDRDTIKPLVHKSALMDLLSVLTMVCVDKKIIEGTYRNQYPRMIMNAEMVIGQYNKMYPENRAEGAASPSPSRGKSVMIRDMSDFERRFGKLRIKAPQVNRATFYI